MKFYWVGEGAGHREKPQRFSRSNPSDIHTEIHTYIHTYIHISGKKLPGKCKKKTHWHLLRDKRRRRNELKRVKS